MRLDVNWLTGQSNSGQIPECRFSEQNSFTVDKVPDLGLPLRNANDDVLYVGPILEFRSW